MVARAEPLVERLCTFFTRYDLLPLSEIAFVPYRDGSSMSAEQLGASLLADVQEETLKQLLTDLRRVVHTGYRPLLGLNELDRLLEVLQPTIPQRQQIPAAHGDFQEDEDDFHCDEVQVNTPTRLSRVSQAKRVTIELTSTAPNSGKTSLLYLLAAIAILPQESNGKESTIIWLDTEARFSASRLFQICLNYLATSTKVSDDKTRQATAKDALKHVHVFPIQSSTQLVQTLEAIPSYLLQKNNNDTAIPTHHSSYRPVSLLILDSAQAFTWPDRFDAEISRLEAIGQHPTSRNPPTSTTSTSNILSKLKALQSKFECTVIYTTNPTLTQQPQQAPSTTSHPTLSTTNPTTPNRPNITHPDTLPTQQLSLWTRSATLSLSYSRIKVPQFATHMSIEECLRDREGRAAVLRKGRVRVWVNEVWLEKVVRDREVKERMVRLDDRGGFVMRVNEKGVGIEM